MPKTILVRAPNWIGDQILAFPFFYFLRQAFPKARIVSVCSPWVESVQFRQQVDEIIVLPRLLSREWLHRVETLEKGAKLLKQRGPWDLAISLPNSFTAAWQIFRAGSKIRRGYSMEGRGFLLNQKESWREGSQLHRADAYLHLLPSEARPQLSSAKFWGVPSENELDPDEPGVLNFFDSAKEWGISDLSEELVQPPLEKYWILAPGSTAESRRWPIERFVSLARRIADETGWTGVIVGGLAEALLAERLCIESSRSGVRLLDRTAQGSVSGLWKLFKNAHFTVANDSGLAHVAALCGSPVQVIWGAGDPKKTRPIGPGQVELSLNAVDCWPCERNICEQLEPKRLECLNGIAIEAIWNGIDQMIARQLRRKESFS